MSHWHLGHTVSAVLLPGREQGIGRNPSLLHGKFSVISDAIFLDAVFAVWWL